MFKLQISGELWVFKNYFNFWWPCVDYMCPSSRTISFLSCMNMEVHISVVSDNVRGGIGINT